jgi:hypothetical protein
MFLVILLHNFITITHAGQPDLLRQWTKAERALSGKRTCLVENLNEDDFLGLTSLPATSNATWEWLQRLSKEDPSHPEYEGNDEWISEMQLSLLNRSGSSPFSITYHDPKTRCVIHLSGKYESFKDPSGESHARIKSLSAIRIAKPHTAGTCNPCLSTNSGNYQIIDSHDSSVLLSSEPLPQSVFEKLDTIKKHPERCE